MAAASLESLLGVGETSASSGWSLRPENASGYDVVISVAGRKYHAHAKQVLRGMRASGTLQEAAATEGSSDKKKGGITTIELQLPTGTPDDEDTFKKVLDFMYGKNFEAAGVLSPGNVTRILLLAEALDIEPAKAQCLTYLLAKLGDKSTLKSVPLTILQSSLQFGSRATSVRVAAIQTIAERFNDYAAADFVDLPMYAFLAIMGHPRLLGTEAKKCAAATRVLRSVLADDGAAPVRHAGTPPSAARVRVAISGGASGNGASPATDGAAEGKVDGAAAGAADSEADEAEAAPFDAAAFAQLVRNVREVNSEDAMFLLSCAVRFEHSTFRAICAAAVSRDFDSIDEDDIAALPPEAVADLLGSGALCGESEDAVMDAVTVYMANTAHTLSKKQVARLWGCVRFAFLSCAAMFRASATPGVPPHFIHEAIYARAVGLQATADYVSSDEACMHPGDVSRLSRRPGIIPRLDLGEAKTMSEMEDGARDKAVLALRTWLAAVPGYTGASCELLFRATEHGWASGHFHPRCDNKGPTLVIARSNTKCVFGGYAAVDWDSSGTYRAAPQGFLFRLHSAAHPDADPMRCVLKRDSTHQAIHCHSSHGPTFGNYDWHVPQNMAAGGGYVQAGSSYELPDGETNKHFMNDGTRAVAALTELEVWRLS